MQKFTQLALLTSILMTLITAPSLANANSENTHQTLDKKEAQQQNHLQILQDSLDDAQKKLTVFLAKSQLAFTREKVDRDGEIESYRYTPTSANEGKWRKLDTDYSTNRHDEKVWESDIFFAPESFELAQVTLIDETDTSWQFDLPIALNLTVDSDEVEPSEKDKESFRAVITLNKLTKHATSLKIYSIKEFSPQLGVTVDSFESHNTLSPLFENGPLIISRQRESIRGDFGFFVSLDEDTEIKNFDFSVMSIEQ